tara:strand:- start:420 stop:608 length:189 start_codon:yes stop_codon:yes gene_type:complete
MVRTNLQKNKHKYKKEKPIGFNCIQLSLSSLFTPLHSSSLLFKLCTLFTLPYYVALYALLDV